MLRTVQIGSCVSIQGIFVKKLKDGRIRIRDGENFFDGWAISTSKLAA